MNLVVIGDCLLDVDLIGSVRRVCPDAPALVVDEDTRRSRPGGAGLAAWLAAAAGDEVTFVTALADDADGAVLRAALDPVRTVAGPVAAPTPVKTRVRSAGHTIARIDRAGTGVPAVTDEMLAAVHDADAVLVSDYGCGLTRVPALRRAIATMVERVPVVWDPHPRGARPVRGATVATPNLDEAAMLAGQVPSSGAKELAARLLASWRARSVAVTLGERGALLHDGERVRTVPATRAADGDPCGAGDRFAVAVTSRLMRHDTVPVAVERGVAAAAEFVAAGGAAAAFASRPPSTAATDDPTGLAAARRLITAVRAGGGTVVATGGCFDLLHAGHVRTLTAARGLGDCLVVCLNSDESVRGIKGPTRPLNRQGDRAEVLQALGCVDQVVTFDGAGPESVLGELRPDVWVKGGDYTPDSLPETGLVHGWGGEVVVLPYHDGRSTTRLAHLLTEVG